MICPRRPGRDGRERADDDCDRRPKVGPDRGGALGARLTADPEPAEAAEQKKKVWKSTDPPSNHACIIGDKQPKPTNTTSQPDPPAGPATTYVYVECNEHIIAPSLTGNVTLSPYVLCNSYGESSCPCRTHDHRLLRLQLSLRSNTFPTPPPPYDKRNSSSHHHQHPRRSRKLWPLPSKPSMLKSEATSTPITSARPVRYPAFPLLPLPTTNINAPQDTPQHDTSCTVHCSVLSMLIRRDRIQTFGDQHPTLVFLSLR